jgi:hypothetical protein
MISLGTLLGFCLLMGLSICSVAQDVASLNGLVTDASGAVVVSADAVLLDTKTNPSGFYTFPKLLPGPAYTLTVTVPGFQTATVTDIYVGVNTAHSQNVQLTVGNAAITVEVNAQDTNVSLNTTDTTVGNNFDMELIHELPVAVRDNAAGVRSSIPSENR